MKKILYSLLTVALLGIGVFAFQNYSAINPIFYGLTSKNGIQLYANNATADIADWFSSTGIKVGSVGPAGQLSAASITQLASGTTGGTCTMVSGTSCTVTITASYTTPVCVATEQGSGAVAGSCSAGGTGNKTITITAASSNSATWGVLVFGNPN